MLLSLRPLAAFTAKRSAEAAGVTLQGAPRVVGRGHLKIAIQRNGGGPLDCIGFDLGDRVEAGVPAGPLDVVGHVTINEWNERRTEQLQIIDLRRAEP